jgi:hypothetical protein
MEKEFIPYQEALELKQLGFDEPCFGWFASDRTLVKEVTEKTDFTLAPTYSQAFRWFREKYNLNSWVTKEHKYKQPFCWYIQDNYSKYNSDFMTDGIHYNTYFKTYEDAELECLQKLIELVKK